MTIPWGLKFWKNTGLQNAKSLKEHKDIHFEVVIHQEEHVGNCLLELGYIRE